MSKDKWPQDSMLLRDVHESWQEPWGDRRQELVFIGIGMDRDWIEEMLNSCLVTDDEIAEAAVNWQEMSDPFPKWNIRLASELVHSH